VSSVCELILFCSGVFLFCLLGEPLQILFRLINKANFHNFSQYVYFFFLHVSGAYVPIMRRNNCYLCDTWYLSLCMDDCLVCRVECFIPASIAWRSKYLTKMKQFRAEGRQTFYLDESWIDTNLTSQKCWQKHNNVKGIIAGSSSKRLIIVYIGSQNGFSSRKPSYIQSWPNKW